MSDRADTMSSFPARPCEAKLLMTKGLLGANSMCQGGVSSTPYSIGGVTYSNWDPQLAHLIAPINLGQPRGRFRATPWLLTGALTSPGRPFFGRRPRRPPEALGTKGTPRGPLGTPDPGSSLLGAKIGGGRNFFGGLLLRPPPGPPRGKRYGHIP